MKRCCGPCVIDVPKEDYSTWVRQVIGFLQGRQDETMNALQTRMFAAAEEEAFEEAARLRDLIRDIQSTIEAQGVIDAKQRNRDVWGLYRSGHEGAIALLSYRSGVMAEPWVRHISTAAGSNAQWLTSAILTHYETGIHCPPEIIVPFPIDEQDVVEELLQRTNRTTHTYPLPRTRCEKESLSRWRRRMPT